MKSLLCITCVVLLIGSGCNRTVSTNTPDADTLARAINAKYWSIEADGHLEHDATAWIVLSITTPETSMEQKIASISELPLKGLLVIQHSENGEYNLSLHDIGKGCTYSCNMQNDIFRNVLILWNSNKNISIGDYFVKTGDTEVKDNFSRCFRTESGMKLVVKSNL